MAACRLHAARGAARCGSFSRQGLVSTRLHGGSERAAGTRDMDCLLVVISMLPPGVCVRMCCEQRYGIVYVLVVM